MAGTSCCCCASCGIAEVDDIKLKDCDGCDLVRYCCDECQEEHRLQHEKDCKKRANELRDELLFKQPEGSCLGDCPICCLPPAVDNTKNTMMGCCSKIICNGCCYAHYIREDQETCPFCRKPMPETYEEYDKLEMKRIEAKDPVAMCQKAAKEQEQGNHSSSFELDKGGCFGSCMGAFYVGMVVSSW